MTWPRWTHTKPSSLGSHDCRMSMAALEAPTRKRRLACAVRVRARVREATLWALCWDFVGL
eukprot:3151125-Prymnesium_polylepis.1